MLNPWQDIRTRATDSYSAKPFASAFEERRRAFVEHVENNLGNGSERGLFSELIRLDNASPDFNISLLENVLDVIDKRLDCSDFFMTGILRLLYQFIDSPLLTDEFRQAVMNTVLGFKYWPDEKGVDDMCYWTENHYILYSVCGYLAGKYYPDEIFERSGKTGKDKMAEALPRIEKWLDLRFRTGFSEWLSNVYYEGDIAALLNIIDFSGHAELTEKARMVLDTIAYDMAVNSWKGMFVSTHGRTYTKEKKHALLETTTDVTKLLFGMGSFVNEDNMASVFTALSPNYRVPEVLCEIASDTGREMMINRSRHSIRFEDARKWGYGKFDTESGMGLLTYGGYTHPRTIKHMVLMLDNYGWWNNGFFKEFTPFRKAISIGKHFGITRLFAKVFEPDLSRNTMTEANCYSCRTPDYFLSTAQDYRKGMGGDQHHIWQATLAPDAICFTTHPGGYGMNAPDAYWHGSGFLPRSAQVENVNITIYNTPKPKVLIVLSKLLEFTHAWLPKDAFDEVIEKGGWIFARKENGYLALTSRNPYRWQTEEEEAGKEVIADGRKNIWICELGRKARNGSFGDFIESITTAEVSYRGLNVSYHSPSQGRLDFGWKGELRQNGAEISLKDYPRYDNPYGHSHFDSKEISVEFQGLSMSLNPGKGIREIS